MLMMLAVLARDHELRLMPMMLADSANDQWAANAHDALCWLRPADSQLQHWCR